MRRTCCCVGKRNWRAQQVAARLSQTMAGQQHLAAPKQILLSRVGPSLCCPGEFKFNAITRVEKEKEKESLFLLKHYSLLKIKLFYCFSNNNNNNSNYKRSCLLRNRRYGCVGPITIGQLFALSLRAACTSFRSSSSSSCGNSR